MIPKNFSHSNDNRNNYQKESLKCTSVLLSLVINELVVVIWVLSKVPRNTSHIHTDPICMCNKCHYK